MELNEWGSPGEGVPAWTPPLDTSCIFTAGSIGLTSIGTQPIPAADSSAEASGGQALEVG